MRTNTTLRIVSLALLSVSSHAFIVPHPISRPGVACHFANLPSSILTSTIETFDGSQIVDPVVVSGVFWSALKTRFLSLVIGQVLATIVFGVLATITASQLTKVGEWITSKLGEQLENPVDADGSKKRFVKANQAKYTPIPIDIAKLGLCIIIDVIGSSSELLPSLVSNVVLVLEFAEEILPFTDILPLATLCWVLDTFFGESAAARALGIGSNRRIVLNDDSAIDVTDQSRATNDDSNILPDQNRNP
ncbi:hypothetical protein MHU86_5832 [Fragilaria crotonensis]|nr:hypothetical protein MHU86_5832 [Fragilaria crotonensis]